MALERLIGFIQLEAGELPSFIPFWFDLILAGGTIGIFIFIILLLVGIKIAAKFMPFFKWFLIGILAALVVNIIFPMFKIPNPFDWIMQRIGGG